MVNQDVFVSRLGKLKEYVDFLETVKQHDKETYISDPYIYGASERFLHLAIECVIDIGNHIISDMKYRKPESNRDIFGILCENGIISGALCESLSKMASFRNILVHDYLQIDRGIVYDIITKNLDDIKSFAEEAVKFFYM